MVTSNTLKKIYLKGRLIMLGKIRILCYGDSNTWGYIPGSGGLRYGDDERWTKLLARKLGKNFEVIEEGLNSRTLISEDKRQGKEGRNGYKYLIPCLDTHDPIDLVVLMLGTNELKKIYNKTAEDIGKLLEIYYVKTIQERGSQVKNIPYKLLIVSPPIINEETDFCMEGNKYSGAAKKSQELSGIYQDIAKRNNCYFVNGSTLETGIDGVHLTRAGHKKLADVLEKIIKENEN